MKRHIPGLHEQANNRHDIPEGPLLVQVEHASYRHHPQKSFFALRFSVLEPAEHAGKILTGRLYCTPKALWKLNWFLRDFGYDTDLLGRDEVDERALRGLRGVVQVSRTLLNGHCYTNLESFAPAAEWEEISTVWAGVNGHNNNQQETNDDDL